VAGRMVEQPEPKCSYREALDLLRATGEYQGVGGAAEAAYFG